MKSLATAAVVAAGLAAVTPAAAQGNPLPGPGGATGGCNGQPNCGGADGGITHHSAGNNASAKAIVHSGSGAPAIGTAAECTVSVTIGALGFGLGFGTPKESCVELVNALRMAVASNDPTLRNQAMGVVNRISENFNAAQKMMLANLLFDPKCFSYIFNNRMVATGTVATIPLTKELCEGIQRIPESYAKGLLVNITPGQ